LADLERIEQERRELLDAITRLERENKSLRGLLGSSSNEELARARTLNVELKTKVAAAEKALAFELMGRETPIDAVGLSETFRVMKAELLAFCTARKIEKEIEPSLWKSLESL
jgi:hypothetical protein